MKTRLMVASLLILGGAWTDSRCLGSDDAWPQWRGPTRDGQVQGASWPERLEGHLTKVWRTGDLGPSYSGPIVSESMVFTTETRDKKVEIAKAFDRATGEMIWEASWEGAMKVPFFAAKNGSWIRSTPAFDGTHLFVAGMRDVLVCLKAADGAEVWRVDFVQRYGTPLPNFGMVCSPLIDGEHLYIQAGASLCKLKKATGETVWRSLVDAGGMDSTFSSPILAEIKGHAQLLVLTRTHLNGIDPETGEVLWSTAIKTFRGMNILTPVVHEDSVFTATYGGNSQLFDASVKDKAFEIERRWESAPQGYMTSPVISGDHVYFFTSSNRFVCLRLSDGKRMWTSPPTGDGYWSLVARHDRILALSDSGTLRLIRATPDAYEVIDEHSVADAQTWAHLAVVGQQIVIREQEGLSLWSWE